jgi:hypothetical protein
VFTLVVFTLSSRELKEIALNTASTISDKIKKAAR